MGAWAQSNVTIYGRIEVSAIDLKFNATPTKPSSSLKTLSSDASLLGFRGTEDLGDGLRAFFKLETGYQLDTGSQSSPTQFWNRESYVGLGSTTWGSVQLGSQYAPAVFMSGRVDPFHRLGLGANPNLFQGPRGYTLTYNNAIQYLTPDFSGASGKLLVSAGEGAPTGRSYSAQAQYAKGPIFVGATYDQLKVAAPAVGLTGAPVWSRTAALTATYDFGVANVFSWYQTNRIDNLPNNNGFSVGATVPIGQGAIVGSYSRIKAGDQTATQGAIGYDYFLSKRTLLFINAALINNAARTSYLLGTARIEQIGAGLPGPGQDSKGVQVGMRHSF